jgi:hypothetical protein
MGKLTKAAAKLHQQAADLVALPRDLTDEEKEFVLDHWQESSSARNGLDGAFFTPAALARELHFEVYGDRIIDLCAGIGRLAWGCRDLWNHGANGTPKREFVCVEKNPAYVEVGRKVMPEAIWICADIFDLPAGLGTFDTAISNPPFGAVARNGNGPGYTGRKFEYHMIAMASQLAPHGAFIIPQESAPFRYSGRSKFSVKRGSDYEAFERQTGFRLRNSWPVIDTSFCQNEWRDTAPCVEIVAADFDAAQSENAADQAAFTK